MTVKLTGNFLATARCLIFNDGNNIAWTFNSLTNTLEADYSGAGSAGSANPSATIGLTAVDGSADTWMTSDSAPALSEAIIPTWTGLHTFSAGLTVSAGTTTIDGHTLALSANASVGGTNTGDQTIPTGANPSGKVGSTAVNGSAATFMRSDGAPPIDLTAAYAWTGNHIFAPTSGVALLAKTNSGVSGFEVTGSITGPTVQAYGPTAAALVDLTPDSGTFTGTLTGCTTSPTGTCVWTRVGNLVVLMIPSMTGTSNATTLTMTGLPAEIQPARSQWIAISLMEDATSFGASEYAAGVAASGTVTFAKAASSAGWTNTGTKGISSSITIAYLLN